MENEYSKFLQDYFPKTKLKVLKSCGKIYPITLNSNVYYRSLRPIFNDGIGKITLFDQFSQSIISLLIVLPLNDNELISYKLRISAEYSLKYIYSIAYPDETLENVSKLKYRDLNEKLKKVETEYIKFGKLFSIFGNNSKLIHTKVDSVLDYLFLKDKLEKDTLNIKNTLRELDILINDTYITIINIKSIKYQDLSQTSKNIIKTIENYNEDIIYCVLKNLK